MIFQAPGIADTESPMLLEFREHWLELIAKENKYLSGQDAAPSGLQVMVVLMFTGGEMPRNNEGDLPTHVPGTLPAQMELEAVFRARSMALATALQNHGA